MTTPSPSPPTSLSPPSAGEHLARCMTPPAHPPLPPASGFTTALPSPPLPPSLYIPPPIDRRDEIPESEQPPHKRLCLSTLGSRYKVGENSTARGRGIDYGFVNTVDVEARRQGIKDVGYGIRDTWVDPTEAVPEIAPVTLGEVSTRVVELAELHEHDTQDLYALLEDAQDGRSRISQRVDGNSQQVDLLMGDRITLQETELQSHRDHVCAPETHIQGNQTQLQLQSTLIQTQHQVSETSFQMQQTEMAALRESDRRRQAQMAELLVHREQQRGARQPGLEARIPDHHDASEDADSHI
ncbi:hypothetical protein Tco_0304788 [Tanacetum coccineum]